MWINQLQIIAIRVKIYLLVERPTTEPSQTRNLSWGEDTEMYLTSVRGFFLNNAGGFNRSVIPVTVVVCRLKQTPRLKIIRSRLSTQLLYSTLSNKVMGGRGAVTTQSKIRI